MLIDHFSEETIDLIKMVVNIFLENDSFLAIKDILKISHIAEEDTEDYFRIYYENWGITFVVIDNIVPSRIQYSGIKHKLFFHRCGYDFKLIKDNNNVVNLYIFQADYVTHNSTYKVFLNNIELLIKNLNIKHVIRLGF